VVYLKVTIMVVRIARILSAGVMLVLLADVQTAVCEGWSLPNPFASKTDTKTKKSVTKVSKTTKAEPSVLEKASTGTKNFFSKTGETLGLKKPEPKRPTAAYPKPPVLRSPYKPESKSWVGSLFKPEEPKKDKTVSDWMQKERLDP
jgi:hypothetical protein